MQMINISAIGSPHWFYKKIDLNDLKSRDILIVNGNWSGLGTLQDTVDFISWVKEVKIKHKIVVPGTSDKACETDEHLVRTLFRKNGIIFLNHEYTEVMGLKIFGTPLQTQDATKKYYSYCLSQLNGDIPKDLDIFITSNMAKYYLDLQDGYFRGDLYLAKKLSVISPKYFICAGAGKRSVGASSIGTLCINSTYCNIQNNEVYGISHFTVEK